MNYLKKRCCKIIFGAILLISASVVVASEPLDSKIHALQKEWAVANYDMDEKQLEKVFADLNNKAEQLTMEYPQSAEPLVWQAIILSTDAGKNGGLRALGKVKKSKTLLLKAEQIDAEVLNGSIYTSLGSLYYQVPIWPIAFGDDSKAEFYLKKALMINPEGIDSNYFYADFLLDQARYQEAKSYFERALKAPARQDRTLADKGRRSEVQKKLQIVNQYL
ncbi:MAG: hypothetical protein KZQ83_09240 [gamma proteobacterium symbiont of Taylorina sp.]|nr:hypothetical protein [gamma proteobacterium symbiont of Taylorina sp.]